MALGLGTEFPVISSNLKAGYGVFGTADPYNANLPNNGALNPPGSVYFVPSPSEGSIGLASAVGYGAGLWVKYVNYYDPDNTAMVAGPAPVIYKDGTFTTVSGDFSDGYPAANLSTSAAGWLLVNTGSVAGVGVGSAITATILNNGTVGSWVFIALAGFVPSASLAAGAAGDRVYMNGDFTVGKVTPDGSAYSNYNFIGTVLTASANIGHVLAYSPAIF
jgi:hypothetical protein